MWTVQNSGTLSELPSVWVLSIGALFKGYDEGDQHCAGIVPVRKINK
jgi:hypothetical protein